MKFRTVSVVSADAVATPEMRTVMETHLLGRKEVSDEKATYRVVEAVSARLLSRDEAWWYAEQGIDLDTSVVYVLTYMVEDVA